jgi:hypothetical protein
MTFLQHPRLPSFTTAFSKLLAGLCLLALALVGKPAGAHDHSYGTHGMVLFGDRDGLYLSHLPLMRAPHDHQVVLAVRLADPALDKSVREALRGKTELWTIEPERFELSRLDPASSTPLRAFGADIFNGHFERDGRRVHSKAQLLVEKVVVYRKLDTASRTRTHARYLPIGRFLVKEIDSRPDFDHIVALGTPALRPAVVPKSGLDNPEAFLTQGFDVRGTVYFDTADLR